MKFSHACAPQPPELNPGETLEMAYKRLATENITWWRTHIKNNIEKASSEADSVYVGKISKEERYVSFFDRAKFLFSHIFDDEHNEDFAYNGDYEYTQKLTLDNVDVIRGDSGKVRTIKFKYVFFECSVNIFSEYIDSSGIKKSLFLEGDTYEPGEHYLVYTKDEALIYLVSVDAAKDAGINMGILNSYH
jgi:hypothetical protein